MPRIFKQQGQGYGPSNVTVTAQIDGNTVFSGNVPTIDAPIPGMDLGVQLGVTCFSWNEPDDFTGTRTLSISVDGEGTFQLNSTLAQDNWANIDSYGPFYRQTIGNIVYSDPLTNVMIDGISFSRTDDSSLTGQYGWNIPSGSVFTATLNINIGMVTTPS